MHSQAKLCSEAFSSSQGASSLSRQERLECYPSSDSLVGAGDSSDYSGSSELEDEDGGVYFNPVDIHRFYQTRKKKNQGNFSRFLNNICSFDSRDNNQMGCGFNLDHREIEIMDAQKLNKKLRKVEHIYRAVMGMNVPGLSNSLVSNKDVLDLIRALGGGSLPGANSYWLPQVNEQGEVSRNEIVKIVMHVRHSGSETYPIGTLRDFLRPAIIRSGLNSLVQLD